MENNINVGIYDNIFNPFVFNQVPEGSLCLDIGCWTGNLGKKLINKKWCVVYGIDYMEKALGVAKISGYRNVYKIDLNNKGHWVGMLSRVEKYDCIICSDVLEHVLEPENVLKQLGEVLDKHGVIIISIPNVAFIQQRFLLMLGIFDYDPKGGLMDKTHIRFYTKKGILNMVKDAGFDIVSFTGYALVRDRFFFLRFLSKIWPELFALQFLLKVSKPDSISKTYRKS
jgi:2-polyprenyl-3-methyl-5-hydroxy-6-metoxy-1,4-benzoquinol methylase